MIALPGHPREHQPELRHVEFLIACPGCGVPAEIAERFVLPSTDGPIEHVAVNCVAGHHYRMAADRLPTEQLQRVTRSSVPYDRPGDVRGTQQYGALVSREPRS
jgi:hypothetical protein